jgi:hypothetical protein
MAAPEPSRAGRQGLEPCDTWQHRSPPKQGGGIRSRVTCGSTEALSSREAGSRAMGHVAVLEPASAGRQGPESYGTWQCTDACPSPCLGLNLVWGGYPIYRVPTAAEERYKRQEDLIQNLVQSHQHILSILHVRVSICSICPIQFDKE